MRIQADKERKIPADERVHLRAPAGKQAEYAALGVKIERESVNRE